MMFVTVDVGAIVFASTAMRLLLFVLAVTGVVLIFAGSIVGGHPASWSMDRRCHVRRRPGAHRAHAGDQPGRTLR
jgi:hypothetical protein